MGKNKRPEKQLASFVDTMQARWRKPDQMFKNLQSSVDRTNVSKSGLPPPFDKDNPDARFKYVHRTAKKKLRGL